MSMVFHWRDYVSADACLVDQWLDDTAVAMTGIDSGWDQYWNEVVADSANYPGCKDFCQIVSIRGVPVAAVVFGCYRGGAVISEILVAPSHRAKGVGTQIIKELIARADVWFAEEIKRFCAVIFRDNVASKKAFQNAGFVLGTPHDVAALEYIYEIQSSLR